MIHTPAHTDISKSHWIYRLTPRPVWPYLSLMRMDRPIGIWLLLLPSWWAITMEAGGVTQMTAQHFYVMVLFGIGSIIMRGAGCVINDIWDRDIDKAVERTKMRPLASGQISVRNAIIFTLILMGLGAAILIQLPPLATLLGLLSLCPVILYPLAKRVTWYPQAVLGLTFNFGILMGAASVTGHLSTAAILLYIAGFFWTLGYDTIYAHQDVIDDELASIKSTARKFGNFSPLYISVFYMVFAGLVFAIGLLTNANSLFYVFWAFTMLYWIRQMKDWDRYTPQSCLHLFRNNRNFGFGIFAAFLMGYISLI